MIDTPTFKLSQAIAFNRVDEVKQLIAADASLVNTLDENNHYPLFNAVGRGKTEIVKLLLAAGADVRVREPDYGDTALMRAANRADVAVIKMLLAAGADAKPGNNRGQTALFGVMSDRTKSNLEALKLLIAAGADPGTSDGFWTILSRAACSGSPDMVKTLIDAGADVNGFADAGTPLMTAIEEGRADNVAVLLEHGADVSLRLPADFGSEELAGKTALDVAREKKAKKIIPLLEAAGSAKSKPAAKAKKAPAKKAKAPTVAESWKAIDAWLKANAADTKKSLKRPATDKKLADLEKVIAAKLPADFRESLQIHDGQEYGEQDLVPAADGDAGYFLLASADIVKEWQRWKKLHDQGEFADQQSGPDKGISDAWWNPGWIPFASNGGGDLLCIDLAPAKGGASGQVITMSHEDSKRERLADSFAHWLAETADSLSTNG